MFAKVIVPFQRPKPFFLVLVCLFSLAFTACVPKPVSPSSICAVNGILLQCPYNTVSLNVMGVSRKVYWQVPQGMAPDGGWPTVIMFQGTGATAPLFWVATPGEPFGGYYQVQVVQTLLDNGFAVLTPETHLGGFTFWDTNNPLVLDYYSSNDHALMMKIFEGLSNGTFGDVNPSKLFASGISSGGYMTSRMAVSYQGKFKALAIAAGSYATCAGPLCVVGNIPANHPPTLFLHGGIDPVVPLFTMESYFNALRQNGIPTKKVVDALALHAWIKQSPRQVLQWFQLYNN